MTTEALNVEGDTSHRLITPKPKSGASVTTGEKVLQ
jgi:hypothetical protein